MHIEDGVRKSRVEIASKILIFAYNHPAKWDERCQFNIKHIGEQFLKWLGAFDGESASDIDHIYCMSYRFLCEYDFLIGSNKELSMDLRSMREKIQNDVGEMEDDIKSQIVYASYVMPANITKEFVNDQNIGIFVDFKQTKEKAEKLKKEWDDEISKKNIEVEQLKDKLDEYKIGFNFVGLYKRFFDLGEKKKKDLFWLFLSLLGMGIIILIPLTIEVYMAYGKVNSGEALNLSYLGIFLPVLTIEVILIYYFRVILFNLTVFSFS